MVNYIYSPSNCEIKKQIMNKKSAVNTGLLFLYLLTLVLYWTDILPDLNRNAWLFAISSGIMIIMTGFYYLQLSSNNNFSKSDLWLLAIFTFLMIGHIMNSQTNLMQGVNIIVSVYLYFILSKVPLNTMRVYKVVFWSFIIITIVYSPFVIRGLLELTNERAAFSGPFSSANSIGDLGLSALFCYLLFSNSDKRRNKSFYLLLLLVLLIIISSHQRSAILVLLSWLIAYQLLKRNWNKKIIFVGFILVLTVVGFAMVYNEVISTKSQDEGVEVFGKESTSRGRSEQIFLALNIFDITPWGEGRGVVNASVKDEMRYAVHNTFVASILEYGYLIFAFYFLFWYRLFNKGTILSASFILAYHVLLFFEPENFFSNQLLPFIAFSLVMISEGEEQRKNIYQDNLKKLSIK